MAERLIIDHVGHRGDGVAPRESGSIHVPYTLGGEIVDAERDGQTNRMRLIGIETASAERIAPFCPHFGSCGGCAIQHWQPAAYQNWKRGLVVEALRRAGIPCAVGELIDAHGVGRRRVTIHARRDPDLRVGFAAAHSHAIVAIDRCPILDPALAGAFDAARALAATLAIVGKPLDIQVTATLNGLDIDVRGSGPLPPPLIASLSRLAERMQWARLTRHGETMLQRAPPVIAVGKAEVLLPPGAFLQATTAGEDALAMFVVTSCRGAKRIADLFCGVGPFALRLAEKARVTAFDNAPGAIAALDRAAKATAGLKPAVAELRDLFRRPLVPQELRDFDAVVFDPPRQGAQAQARELAASNVPLVIAVSCDLATFVRDARILIDGDFKIEQVIPVDQFRHTPHVELMARFRR